MTDDPFIIPTLVNHPLTADIFNPPKPPPTKTETAAAVAKRTVPGLRAIVGLALAVIGYATGDPLYATVFGVSAGVVLIA